MKKTMSKKIFLGCALSSVILSTTVFAAKETVYSQKPSVYEGLTGTKGGSLYLTLSNNPKVINPILSADANSSSLEPFIWATLFTEDEDTLQPLPYLATTYKISKDKKTYTFELNKEAKWQDGTPVTTADVKFSFDSMMNPKVDAAAIRSYWEGVSIEVVDAQTFKFVVKEPKFDTLRSLYLFTTIQKKQFEKESDFNKAKGIMNPVGNGPYKFARFSRDQRLDLERNKEWWGNNLAHFKNRYNPDKIIFRITTDPNLEYERFVKGDVDLIQFGAANADIYANRVKGNDKARFGSKPGEAGKTLWAAEFENNAPRGYSYVGWNLRKPIFSSKKTRQALARLVDYEQINNSVLFGLQYQSTSPFGSKTMNADQDLRKKGKMLTFDRSEALKLLRADGWKDTDGDNILDKKINGKKVDFKFSLKFNSNNPARGKIAQIIRENFKAAGIDVDIRSMEWNAYLTDVDNRNFDSIVLGWTATPYPNPKQIWHSSSEANQGSNFVGFKNSKVDQLIEKANAQFDLSARAKTLQEINRIIYDEQPYLFLFEPRALVGGFNKKLKSEKWALNYSVSAPFDIYSIQQ